MAALYMYTYVADFVIGKEILKVHFSYLYINRCIVEWLRVLALIPPSLNLHY